MARQEPPAGGASAGEGTEERGRLAEWLGRLGDETDIPLLATVLRQGLPGAPAASIQRARPGAARGLAHVGTPAAVEAVADALASMRISESQRTAIVRALFDPPPAAPATTAAIVAATLARLDERDAAGIRVAAAAARRLVWPQQTSSETGAAHGLDELVQPILRWTSHPSPSVRTAVLLALGHFTTRNAPGN